MPNQGTEAWNTVAMVKQAIHASFYREASTSHDTGSIITGNK